MSLNLLMSFIFCTFYIHLSQHRRKSKEKTFGAFFANFFILTNLCFFNSYVEYTKKLFLTFFILTFYGKINFSNMNSEKKGYLENKSQIDFLQCVSSIQIESFSGTGGPRYMRKIGTRKLGSHITNSHIKRPWISII